MSIPYPNQVFCCHYRNYEHLSSNIPISDEELTLLEKGLKYNINRKPKHWIKTIALEAESAITLLPPVDQDFYRRQVAETVKRLYQTPILKNQRTQKEIMTLKQIRTKLTNHEAKIVKADKGNSLIIIYNNTYTDKTNQFITNNQIMRINNNPTNQTQKAVRKIINQC
jgi:hypothetical protein